jgi:hypothetical protein
MVDMIHVAMSQKHFFIVRTYESSSKGLFPVLNSSVLDFEASIDSSFDLVLTWPWWPSWKNICCHGQAFRIPGKNPESQQWSRWF